MVNKNVRAILLLNKSETFLVAEPLNCSMSHDNILLSLKFSTFHTGGCYIKNEVSLQKKLPRRLQAMPNEYANIVFVFNKSKLIIEFF
jgi:hypothetical protein